MTLLAQTVVFGATDAVKWTDIGIFGATVVLAVVTGFLFNATRNMAGQTKTLAEKTADMAKQTAELARDTVDASNRADEHHQQSLWPNVVITKLGNFGPQSVKIDYQNIGAGPAPKVYIEAISVDGYLLKAPCEYKLRPLFQGGVDNSDLYYYPPDDTRRIGGNLPTSFRVRLLYQTMFGSTGSTLYDISRAAHDFSIMESVQPEIIRRAPVTTTDVSTPRK